MNKTLPITALLMALAALLITLISHNGTSPVPTDTSPAPAAHDPALDERLARLEAQLGILEASQQRLLDLLAQPHATIPNPRAVPSEQVQTRLDDLADKQTKLEEFTKHMDRLGLIESMENELLKAHHTLLDTNLPVWTRAKQADTLKRFNLFGDEAVASMMELWNQTTDHNEKAAILYALSGVVTTPAFRNQILASLQEEVQQDNPSPKFRYTAVRALQPMLPDSSVEEWLQYMADNDPELGLREQVAKMLQEQGSTPAK